MAQVKKEAVRARILAAASKLFEKNGYVGSTMGQIAARANLSASTIYVYFPSKLDIAFAIFEPWIAEHLLQIEMEAHDIKNPRRRLAHLLRRLWRDIPYERSNYFNNFIQALAVSRANGYRPSILIRMRERIAVLMYGALSEERRKQVDVNSFAHIIVMAFDGFVINAHLHSHSQCADAMILATCDLILGDAPR